MSQWARAQFSRAQFCYCQGNGLNETHANSSEPRQSPVQQGTMQLTEVRAEALLHQSQNYLIVLTHHPVWKTYRASSPRLSFSGLRADIGSKKSLHYLCLDCSPKPRQLCFLTDFLSSAFSARNEWKSNTQASYSCDLKEVPLYQVIH